MGKNLSQKNFSWRKIFHEEKFFMTKSFSRRNDEKIFIFHFSRENFLIYGIRPTDPTINQPHVTQFNWLTTQLMDGPNDPLTNKWTNQLTNQPTTKQMPKSLSNWLGNGPSVWLTNWLINQPSNLWTNPLTDQPTNQPTDQPQNNCQNRRAIDWPMDQVSDWLTKTRHMFIAYDLNWAKISFAYSSRV